MYYWFVWVASCWIGQFYGAVCILRLFLVNFLMTFTNQENHSGYPIKFASPYIMRLLKRGGLDYGVRLMKRDNEGLGEEEMSGVQMIKRGANEEEANGDYGIRIMRKRIPEVNEQRSSKIILWRGEPYSIEMPKQGGEDPDEYEVRRRRMDPYGVRLMKRAEDSARIIKKESEPYGFRLMKRAAGEEDMEDDDGTRIIKKESQLPYGIRMMKRDSGEEGTTRIIKKENEGYGLRLMKRESAGYGIRMMRRGERGGYGIRMMKAKLDEDLE